MAKNNRIRLHVMGSPGSAEVSLRHWLDKEPIYLHIDSDVGSHSCGSTMSIGGAAMLAQRLNDLVDSALKGKVSS